MHSVPRSQSRPWLDALRQLRRQRKCAEKKVVEGALHGAQVGRDERAARDRRRAVWPGYSQIGLQEFVCCLFAGFLSSARRHTLANGSNWHSGLEIKIQKEQGENSVETNMQGDAADDVGILLLFDALFEFDSQEAIWTAIDDHLNNQP